MRGVYRCVCGSVLDSGGVVGIAGCRTAEYCIEALMSRQQQSHVKLAKLSCWKRKGEGVASYDGLEALPSSQKAGLEIDRRQGSPHVDTYLASSYLVLFTRQSVSFAALALIGES